MTLNNLSVQCFHSSYKHASLCYGNTCASTVGVMTQCFIVSNLKAPTVQLRQDARCPHESTVPVDGSRHVTVRDRPCRVSVLIWPIPAPGTTGASRGVGISDRGSGGPRDNRIWVVAGRETRFRQERKELQCGQYLRNGHVLERRQVGADREP